MSPGESLPVPGECDQNTFPSRADAVRARCHGWFGAALGQGCEPAFVSRDCVLTQRFQEPSWPEGSGARQSGSGRGRGVTCSAR